MSAAGFTESTFQRKLRDLNASAQCIQQLSLWLIHHRKHCSAIVKTWYREFGKVPSASRKLAFLYLANDVVQNSKKKYPELFAKEYGGIMKKVLEQLAVMTIDSSTVKSISRLLKIWKDRATFNPKIQAELDRIWSTKQLEAKSEETAVSADTASSTEASPVKKPKRDPNVSKPKRKPSTVSSDGSKLGDELSDTNSTAEKNANDVLQSILSPANSPTSSAAINSDPPESEELIKALQELENAASSDATVRETIAKLPSAVSEVSALDNLKSPEDAKTLMGEVDHALGLLTKYNDRLQQELKDRRRVKKMIADYLAAQKDLETQAEERLEQYRDKLEKVNSVRDDLKSHIQSLPDLTKLPDVTGGLAPLPSAGDLFTK